MKKHLLFIFIAISLTLQAQNPYFEISKQMEIYNDVLKKLSTNYIDDINLGDLIQKNTKKTLNGLDRFTTFYDEQGIINQKMRQEGHYGGLGISTRFMDSVIVITDIFKNSPASKDLVIGDKIIEIEDKKVSELTRELSSNLLKGPAGSKVSVVIDRNGKRMKKELDRADIALDAVTATRLDGDIGYIRFVKFNKKASSQMKKAVLDLKKQGAEKLIIDARGNPGGLLSEVIRIVNFFIPKGKVVVTTKGRFEKFNKTYLTRNESMDEEIPIVILVDNHSASAAEILSGSLQDYDRAVIIGDTTYGKGLVQRTYPLKYGTYMKQTISKYYIPSGRLIQKIDYWHRDKNGKPLLMSENLPEKDYKTANGRIVHNLGGIIPDIVMEDNPNQSIIRDLKKKNYIFDFATDYYYSHDKPADTLAPVLKEKDFHLFLEYLKKKNLHPKSTAEISLEKAYEKAQKENQPGEVLQKYKELLQTYQDADEKILKQYQSYILNEINRDLINRYFGQEGATAYKLQHDKQVLKAKEILNNEKEYNKILKK